MKALACALFIFALAVVSAAQAQMPAINPPDIVISKTSWSAYYASPASLSSSAAAASSSLYKEKTDEITMGRATPQPEERERPDYNPLKSRTERSNSGVIRYRYQATLKNTGTRTVEGLEWEYVFTNTRDQKIVGRYRFRTRVKIAPGKKITLNEFSNAAPTKVINARAGAKHPGQRFTEQVVIIGILYTDGSVWEQPFN